MTAGGINNAVRESFFTGRAKLPETPIVLLIESPGGSAHCAYQIAKLIRRRCGAFIAIVPRYAKSAATLLALGARGIALGEHAELGPLDAQIVDYHREQRVSALEEVQALERLNATSLLSATNAMQLLSEMTKKRTDIIMPAALRFAADMMRPLLEHIDVAQYSQRSRMLKVAEEYAIRLLMPAFTREVAAEIASKLVEDYPDHSFVIDIDEARGLGLNILSNTKEQERALDKLLPHLKGITAIGSIEEAS